MTELMKRYEAETGKKAIVPCGQSIMTKCSSFYIAWLESQLTWRPVSEKPETGGEYLVKSLDEIGDVVEDFDKFANRDGKWCWLSSNVIKWLPIPPAPEGETNERKD